MGRIVGGFGMSHVLFPPGGVEDQAERVIEGMLEIRRRVAALRPDVIVLAGSDHLNNFSLAAQITLAVGVSDSYTTLGDGPPVATFPGHRAFAEAFARFAEPQGFDLVQMEELKPDHGMALPKLILDPSNTIPIVPVYINAIMPMPPSPRRCHRLGAVLKEMVEQQRPEGERVVVVGAGGLSHWLCLPEQGRVAEKFDEDFIARMIAGRAEDLAGYTNAEIFHESGNGGMEVTAWLFMAGALPGGRGDRIFYEAVPEWISGMGGLALLPADA